MLRSMTGFASATGSLAPFSWSWELRSVNGKGQDLRLRVPDWIDGLEMALRQKLANRVKRGSVTLSLRLSRDESATHALRINEAALDAALAALAQIEARAGAMGLTLAPSRASDLLALRGLTDAEAEKEETAPLSAQLQSEADALIEAFDKMRRDEGAALKDVLSAQLAETERLTEEAASLLGPRQAAQADALKRNLALVLANSDGADADRVAQELAMIAVKSDVQEEIDRLRTHVEAARALLGEGGSVGRKLDFLMQEFNREANTLCSKAQHKDLTRCGLALKTVIDQMREQIQNVE